MATKIDAGASTPTPVSGAPPPRKKKVTPPSGSNPVTTTALADTNVSTEQAAVQTALRLFAQIVAVLAPITQPLTASGKVHMGRVSATREALIPATAVILRGEPALGPTSTADDLDRGVAYVADLRALAGGLQTMLTDVDHTTRTVVLSNWAKARLTITMAQHLGKTDGHMATVIAPVVQMMKRGPQAVGAQNAISQSQQQVARGQQALTRSQRKADLAQRSADVAKAAQDLAEARRTGGPLPAAPPAPVPAAGAGAPHTG